MKLAIVGSTLLAGNAEAAQLIEDALDRFKPDAVVSGGAYGIDTMAEQAAKNRGIEVTVFLPDVNKWDGPGGFRDRNLQIAQECDALVRIVSSRTRTYGSGWTRDRAKEMGKPTENFVVQDGEEG